MVRAGSAAFGRLLRRTVAIVSLCAAIVVCTGAVAHAAEYDPLDVISYDTWRASKSMSQSDIQAFLAAQTGVLDTYRAPDNAGVVRSASSIIYGAAQAWNLNPKVILATLQKEQSLLTMREPSAKRLREAMGCGIYAGSTNRYPGFGSQVWNGARKLSTYEVTFGWKPGLAKRVTAYTESGLRSKIIVPANACTYALYTYTPYYPQKLFWDVYVRYFGDPHSPPRLQRVYRLYDRKTRSFVYTSSEGERYRTTTRRNNPYQLLGVAFSIDNSATANNLPLYRMQDYRTGLWSYTVNASLRDRLVWSLPTIQLDKGIVGKVASPSTSATSTPVYRLEHKLTHATYLTTSAATRTSFTGGAHGAYRYRGIMFRLAKSVETTRPIGPANR